jgi:hypothetical protein
LPEVPQCPPRGYIPEASGSNVGKRQKQAHRQEKPNEGHLKREGPALIGEQGGQFVFSGQDRSFSQSVTFGVTLTLKTSGSGTLCGGVTS